LPLCREPVVEGRLVQDALPTLEQRMTDVRAVMDAVGSKRATLVGYSEGGSMCAPSSRV
jgi:pimeloyl-ACP methyl ester carboxylesterase